MASSSALVEVDEMLARNPNYKLGYLIKGDLLMASAGQPVAFASNGAPPADVLPLQDEARVRVKRYIDAPPTCRAPRDAAAALAPPAARAGDRHLDQPRSSSSPTTWAGRAT